MNMQPQPATLPLPQFSQINIQQLKQDILDLIQRGLNLLAQVQTPQDFQHALTTIEQFDEFENQFSELFGVLSHLNAVMNTPELREVYQSLLPEISNFYTQAGQNEALFQTYQFKMIASKILFLVCVQYRMYFYINCFKTSLQIFLIPVY